MVIAQMMTLRMNMLQKWMMRLYIVVAPEDFFLYERNQFWTNLIIIVYIFLKFEWKYAKFKDKINSDYAAVTI